MLGGGIAIEQPGGLSDEIAQGGGQLSPRVSRSDHCQLREPRIPVQGSPFKQREYPVSDPQGVGNPLEPESVLVHPDHSVCRRDRAKGDDQDVSLHGYGPGSEYRLDGDRPSPGIDCDHLALYECGVGSKLANRCDDVAWIDVADGCFRQHGCEQEEVIDRDDRHRSLRTKLAGHGRSGESPTDYHDSGLCRHHDLKLRRRLTRSQLDT